MAECKRYKVAAIDLGTVSSRLVLAQVEAGAIVESSKHTEITDLGEGVDATGRFCRVPLSAVHSCISDRSVSLALFGKET